MTEQGPCPDAARWRQLLDGSLADDEQAALSAHLETCAACQRALEGLAAGSAAWWRAARHPAGARPDEPALRRVLADLEAQAPAGGDESGRAEGGPPTLEERLCEGPGTVLGPYKLLQQIGEGGMGAVFLAEQTRPVRRQVAVKVIKPGMDSAPVIARFEAERQALALMDHPNIAKVLDAGTTEAGRPYFVMELVKGVPLTRYCDERRLTLKERLELFIPVCQAVQHAHQKGSSTATSSPPTSWSPSTTAGRRPRSSTSASPRRPAHG